MSNINNNNIIKIKENDSFKKSSLTQIEPNDIIILKNIINDISLQDEANPFLYPVDTNIYQDYLRSINNHPMDISTIKKKLENNRYNIIQEVVDDFQLIWDNCRIYNQEGSDFYNYANNMENFCKNIFEKNYIIQKIEKKNFGLEFDKNVYDDEAFNNPNYYIENNIKIDEYYMYLRDKILLLRKIKSLEKNKLKQLIENCDDIKPFIEIDDYYKIHIEKMEINSIKKINEFIQLLN
jgi:hypothetical protein